MSTLARLILSGIFALGLAGCGQDIDLPPIGAGMVYVQGADGHMHEVPLMPQQVLRVSEWFDAHRTGWEGLVATEPLKLRGFGFDVKSSSGRRYSVDVLVWASGDGTVYVYGPKPKFPLSRNLPAEDIRALRAAVGARVVAPTQ
ncbi:hypothetical protein [Burkholderia sp. PU8-34]